MPQPWYSTQCPHSAAGSTSPTCSSHRRTFLSALLISLLCAGWALVAHGGGFADPVRELLDALKVDRDPMNNPDALAYRKQLLTRKAAAVRTLGDLGRALLLQEWSYDNRDPMVTDIDQAVWEELAARFVALARAGMQRGDATTARAIATMLGEGFVASRSLGVRPGPWPRKMGELQPDLIRLTTSPDPAVREAAARALGKVAPTPEKAAAALGRMLREDGPSQRRAAASALTGIVRVALDSERKVRTERRAEDLRSEPIEAGRFIVPVAAIALADPDTRVRRYALEAIDAAAYALGELIVIPVSLEFAPTDRPLTAEERRRITDYAAEVEAERKEVAPLVTALVEQVPAIARVAASDPDVELRGLALRTLERIAVARAKLAERQSTVPVLPPAKPGEPAAQPVGRAAPAGGLGDEVVLVLPAIALSPTRGADIIQTGAVQLGPALPQELPPVVPAQGEKGVEQLPVPRGQDILGEGLQSTLNALVADLRDQDVRNRLAALDALEALGPSAAPAAPAVVGSLADCDPFVRWAAARVLGKLAPASADTAIPGLVLLLCDPDMDLRIAAAVALGRFGAMAVSAVNALAQTVLKGDVDVRLAAMRALAAIGEDSVAAIPSLITVLAHPDPRVRIEAAQLLGRFGPAAQNAVPALEKLEHDPDPAARRAASEAIIDILPAPPAPK